MNEFLHKFMNQRRRCTRRNKTLADVIDFSSFFYIIQRRKSNCRADTSSRDLFGFDDRNVRRREHFNSREEIGKLCNHHEKSSKMPLKKVWWVIVIPTEGTPRDYSGGLLRDDQEELYLTQRVWWSRDAARIRQGAIKGSLNIQENLLKSHWVHVHCIAQVTDNVEKTMWKARKFENFPWTEEFLAGKVLDWWLLAWSMFSDDFCCCVLSFASSIKRKNKKIIETTWIRMKISLTEKKV